MGYYEAGNIAGRGAILIKREEFKTTPHKKTIDDGNIEQKDMSEKDYIDAKPEANDARNREALTSLRADIDIKFAQTAAAIENMSHKLDTLPTKTELDKSSSSTKWAIFIASATVLGVLLSTVSLMFGAFNSGLSSSPAFEERISVLEDTLDNKADKKLEEIVNLIKESKEKDVETVSGVGETTTPPN